MTVDVDDVNIMLLNALLPDSLVHITVKGIHFASPKLTTVHGNSVAGCLSVESFDGKVLKSPTGVSCVSHINDIAIGQSNVKHFLDGKPFKFMVLP